VKKEEIKNKFNSDYFLKRIDKELNSFENKEFITSVISNFYFQEVDSCYSKYEEQFFSEYLEESEVSNKLLRSIIRSKMFNEWFEEFIYHKIDSFLKNLTFEDNQLKIYRAITAGYDFIEKVRVVNKFNAGIFWSYDYEYAIPYNGCPSEDTYIFHANVNLSSIDWYKTIMLNLVEVYGEDEKEIRLFKNRKIFNFSVEKEDHLLHYEIRKKIIS